MLTRTHSHKQAKGDSIELCLVTLRYVALRSERRSAAGPRLALAALRAALPEFAILPVAVGDN